MGIAAGRTAARRDPRLYRGISAANLSLPALLSCAFLRHLVAKRRFGAFQVSRVGFGFDEGISALVGEPGHFSGKVERRAVRREEHIRFQLFQLRERRFKDLDDLRELGIPDVLETRPARAAEEKYVVLFPESFTE